MKAGVLAVFMALWPLAAFALDTVVTVDQGTLQGRQEDGLTVFHAIPFAAPPVGDRRWRAPEPAARWQGVRQADHFAPACAQGGMIRVPGETSEDCLYLNVWTPAQSAGEKLPVLVWIHGGSFNQGATSFTQDRGEVLAKQGTVVVNVAYRLGPLGFLAHPELSAESPEHISGNYGLLDMIAGLRWVRQNIEAFGGDPGKVTIFGVSAGAMAVSMLCASPEAKGLFDAAISQSGGSFAPARPGGLPGENMRLLADAERKGVELARNAHADSIADLRKLPAAKIIGAGYAQGLAWPNIDGRVIPPDQYSLYVAGRFNDVPVMIGYNSDEGENFAPPKTSQEYIALTKHRYGAFAESLLKAYPPGDGALPKSARDLTRDIVFGWHTWTWARLQSEHGKSKVFYYFFDQAPDGPDGVRARHTRDIYYVFGHLDQLPNEHTTPVDQAISDAMVKYWVNFAKFGDPNSPGVPQWTAFDDQNPGVMVFSGTPHMGAVPDDAGLRAIDAYLDWRRSPEGSQAAIIEDAPSAPISSARPGF